jgi:hypothetical protein
MSRVAFETLKGKTFTKVSVNYDDYGDNIIFTCSDGNVYSMYHDQDCCESVYIEDICGDLQDIIGYEILVAEEVVSSGYDGEPSAIPPKGGYADSYTWTFYKLDTKAGGVTIRWYGVSNGYYSESVNLHLVK